MVLENIVEFLLISAGVGFSFGMFIQFENGVCGKVLSCMLFSGIFDSCRVTPSEGQKVLLFFLFFQNVAHISG